VSWGSQPCKGTCSGHAADLNQGGNRPRSLLKKKIPTLEEPGLKNIGDLKFREEVRISSDSSGCSLEGHESTLVVWGTKGPLVYKMEKDNNLRNHLVKDGC